MPRLMGSWLLLAALPAAPPAAGQAVATGEPMLGIWVIESVYRPGLLGELVVRRAAAGWAALLYGNPGLLAKQALGAIAPLLYAAVLTAIILKVIDVTIGLRVHAADEARGLDLSQHAEAAYAMAREFNIGESVPPPKGE